MYEIIYSPAAWKQLEKLEKSVKERIINALDRLRIRPEAYASKLVNESAYKLRAGDYRVIFDIDHGNLIILVIKIGHRRNIYKF